MYSEETVQRIEQRHEREIADLRERKTRILAIERVLENHSEILQILDVSETPQGLYVRVR